MSIKGKRAGQMHLHALSGPSHHNHYERARWRTIEWTGRPPARAKNSSPEIAQPFARPFRKAAARFAAELDGRSSFLNVKRVGPFRWFKVVRRHGAQKYSRHSNRRSPLAESLSLVQLALCLRTHIIHVRCLDLLFKVGLQTS